MLLIAPVEIALLGMVALTLPLAQEQDPVPIPHVVQTAYERGTRNANGAPGDRYWQIQPEYELEGRLEPTSATVYGSGIITFVNRSPDALHEIVLRLDQNRFRGANVSSVRTRGIDIQNLTINGESVDLRGPNVSGITSTVLRVRLKRQLQPGQVIEIQTVWNYEVPLDVSGQTLRQGRWGNDVFQLAQWYPRLAMYDDLGGWDTTPHDGSREFFNPFARFRVNLQVPVGWLVGATGILTNRTDVLGPVALIRLATAEATDTMLVIVNADERKADVLVSTPALQTWRFTADSVSDFAWGASANYAWAIQSRTTATQRVLVHALMTPRHREALIAASERTADAIVTLSSRILPYPWRNHVLIDGPEGAMEYPGLTMSNGTTISHEIGHQWFPMIVGSDETRFDFLDEGLATFYAVVVGNGRIGQVREERASLEPLLVANDLRTPRFVIGYGRGSHMLHALAARVGEERLLSALQRYATEWRFKHPSPWDFMASMERHLGENLDAFWRAWLFSADAIPP